MSELDELHTLATGLVARIDELRTQPPPPRNLLTLEQVAERLGVGRTTVQELVDRGALPVVKVTNRAIRVDPADVDTYVKQRRERRGGR